MAENEASAEVVTPAGIDGVLARNLKRVRTARGISLAALARDSGLARATLYQMETAEGNPTIDTIWAVSNALKVPLSELLSEAEPPPVQIIRAGAGPNVVGETLVARLIRRFSFNNGVLELFHMRIEPGGVTVGHAHPPGVHEHVLVMQGELRTGPEDHTTTLAAGDYISFRADVPHGYEALSAEPVLATLIMDYPPAMDLRHLSTPH
ncbi:MAG: family transcriptional regulator [Marmoricola sp.]|nr:family transcriptional regulator [Marmoricola sp.]